MKQVFALIVLLLLAGIVYWLGSSLSWWGNDIPRNLPTAEERERIRAVEEARMQEAPDAKAGIQVREPGSTPPPTPETTPAAEPAATTSATTSEEIPEP